MINPCPKCAYIRQPGDTAPDYECPNCGVVYEKFRQHLAQKAAREAEEMRIREEEVRKRIAAEEEDERQAAALEAQRIKDQKAAALFEAQNRGLRMMNCPDCEGRISRKAVTCPHCGSPFEPDAIASVSVSDIRMSFVSMVVFMVKWTIAALPAALILSIIVLSVIAAFGELIRRLMS